MEFVMITSESRVEKSFLLDLGIHGLDFPIWCSLSSLLMTT